MRARYPCIEVHVVGRPAKVRYHDPYKGTSLIRNNTLLGPYNRTKSRAIWWPLGGGAFHVSEVPL